MVKIAGLIAAAGKSERMGFPKALAQIHNTTAIQHLTQVFRSANISPIIATLPDSRYFEIKHLLDISEINLTRNFWPQSHLTGSIRSAYPYFSSADALLICPIDMPFVSLELLQAIQKRLIGANNHPTIVAPTFKHKPGHPIAFSRHFYLELIRASNPHGPQSVAKKFNSHCRYFEWGSPSILANLNRPIK